MELSLDFLFRALHKAVKSVYSQLTELSQVDADASGFEKID